MPLFCLVIAILAPAAAHAETFALVVTNNRSLGTERADLHYADDDALQYAALFDTLLGPEKVTVLTRVDDDTAGLGPHRATQGAPTVESLRNAVNSLGTVLAARKAEGTLTELILVFAGHGDLANGEGFLELEDGPLTAAALEHEVIAKLPADRIHLVLDSCNSFFMLYPRKPGGKRWDVRVEAPQGLLERFPQVGAVLSTSAEAITWEWSELRGGLFSHEVRSGLRGAADVDLDGTITYAELASFLDSANRDVPDETYRPNVFVAGPKGDRLAPLVPLPRAGPWLELAPADRRVTIRDLAGPRLLDLHQAADTPLKLLLPEQALVVSEKVGDAPVTHRRLTTGSARSLAEAIALPAGRGDFKGFSAVFNAPHGRLEHETWLKRPVAPVDPDAFGITRRDADRLESFLRIAAEGAEGGQRMAGILGVTGTATLGGFLLAASPGFDTDARVMTQVVVPVLGGIFLLSFGAMPFLPSLERLYLDRYLALPRSTDAERAKAVRAIELEWALKSFQVRGVSTMTGLLLGGLGLGLAALVATSGRDAPTIAAGLVASLSIAAGGLVFGFAFEPPIANLWRQYALTVDREAGGRPLAGFSAQTSDTLVDIERRRRGGTL